MRGTDAMQESLFTVAKLDDFVPSDHPLRAVQALVNQALGRLNGLFNAIYADTGRESIAPEKLMRALLLQVFYSVRSERQLMEQMRYNLLFRWFVGLSLDEAVWDHSVFSKNRDRLLANEVIEAFFAEVMALADKAGLLSKEHFSVDGTLIQAWASQKSFRPKDGPDDQTPSGGGRNAQADWKGRPRSNDSRRGGSAIDGRTTRHVGYRLSQTIRKRIEEHFGWGKTVGRIRQTVFRGLQRVDQHFKLTMTASNLTRMARILFAAPQGARP